MKAHFEKKQLNSNGLFRSVGRLLPLMVAFLALAPSPSRAEAVRTNSNEAVSNSPWDQEETPRRFIQWPRVTIGLVWSDPTSGQMKVMDLGSAPEDGQFTPDVLMSRCMRAANRLSPDGRAHEAFNGASTRTLQPLSDEEVEALLHENASRK